MRSGTPLAPEARMSLVTGSDRSRPGVKLTYDDFLLFPDDGKRHELIDGEHYVTPAPNLKHQAVSANLLAMIWTHLKREPIGKVYAAPLDVVFSHFDVVEPDLLFVSEARRAVLTAKNVQGAPDLVVEIGSPSTRRRDEKLKHQLYERFNVAEYWVVDPDIDVVRVYRLQEGKYLRAQELSLHHGDVLTTPLLPGLDLPLSDIFAE
jgi:Uma2 family endonuclease